MQSEQAEGRCVAGRWIGVDHVIPESQPQSPPNYQNSGRAKQSPDPFRILILSRSLCSYASKSASRIPPQSPLERQRTEAERSTGHTSRAHPKHCPRVSQAGITKARTPGISLQCNNSQGTFSHHLLSHPHFYRWEN